MWGAPRRPRGNAVPRAASFSSRAPSPNFPTAGGREGRRAGPAGPGAGAHLRPKRAAGCSLDSTGTSPPGVGAERVENGRPEKRLAAPPSLPTGPRRPALQPGGPKGKRPEQRNWETGKGRSFGTPRPGTSRPRLVPWARPLHHREMCQQRRPSVPHPKTKGPKQKSEGRTERARLLSGSGWDRSPMVLSPQASRMPGLVRAGSVSAASSLGFPLLVILMPLIMKSPSAVCTVAQMQQLGVHWFEHTELAWGRRVFFCTRDFFWDEKKKNKIVSQK